MKLRVLITGGSGLLALNWAASIQDQYEVILGLHKRSIELPSIATVYLKMDSISELAKQFESIMPDIVINAAGATNVDLCESSPDLAHHVNVDLASNVAKVCSLFSIQMVHISTDHLFKGERSFVNEEYPVCPINVYGRTKALSERAVLTVNPQALIIRSNFYAWGTSYRKSFTDFIIESLVNNREIILFEDVYFTPVPSIVLTKVTHRLIELNLTGIFNIASNERVSKLNFGRMLARKFNLREDLIRPGLLSEQKLKAIRPHDMSLSNRKVCEVLNFNLGDIDLHLEMLKNSYEYKLIKDIRHL